MALDTEPDDDLDDKPRRKAKRARKPTPAMDEKTLIAICRAEEIDSTSYYTSEMAKDQAEAMDRFYGKKYGDEAVGRSTVVTHDIENVINWIMPDLMRVFWQSDNLVNVTSSNDQDEDKLDTIGECLSHVFFNDNPGREILYDYAFDGLLQRLGVASVRWEDPQPEPEQQIEGASLEQVLKYQKDPEYEILSCDICEDGSGYDLELQRTPAHGKAIIEVVAPEEFRISRRAVSIAESGYHARQQELYVADIAALYPDKAGDLDPDFVTSTNKDIEINSDPRTLARHQQEAISTNRDTSNHEKRKKVMLLTEYIRVDFDNDGVVELRQIKRVNDIVLENIAVDESEFVPWSPIRISHKLIGRSLADTMLDHQKVRTVIMRRMMDSLDQSLLNRYGYDKGKMDPEDVDALVDAEIGGLVGTNGAPGEVLMPLTTPDLTASGYQMLEYVDQQVEQASGVTRHSQGMNPEAVNKTATGIDMLQTAANDRVEMVARWLANGLEGILTRALKLLCDHQDGPRWIKIKGKRVEMDPRTWSDQMTVSVHVAMAAANRQTMLSNLAGIAAKQEQAIQVGGPDNPVAPAKKYLNTLRKMIEVMGFRDASGFVNSEEEYDQAVQHMASQPPKPDPKMAEVQQKGQIAQATLEQQKHKDAAELQIKQKTAESSAATDMQVAQMKAEIEKHIQEQKIQAETVLAAKKLEAETAIAQMKLQAEMALAEKKMMMEAEFRRQEMAHNQQMAEKAHSLKAASLGSSDSGGMSTGVRFGGEVG